jgi:hypothetical protein
MQNNNSAEHAARQLRELIDTNIVEDLQGANEAETRLRLVDEVLALLGWNKAEYNPERATSLGDYTDYLLAVDGVSRLIVEAKRVGRVPPPKTTLMSPTYEIQYLHKNCNKQMTELLDQCLGYSMSCGVRYAVATTGDVWIIMVNFKDGVDWKKLRAVVFHSLEDVYKRFDEFYNLISRNAVAQNSLDDHFLSSTTIPRFAARPGDKVVVSNEIQHAPERQIIAAFFDHFMGDITHKDQLSLLKECYVADRKIDEYSRDLQQLLHYNPVIDELGEPIPEADSDSIEKEVEFQLSSPRPKVILLVGHVGAGKTTFVRRFMGEQLHPELHPRQEQKDSVCVVVDFLNRSSVDIQPNRDEEQRLADLILKELAKQFGERLNPYEPNVLKGTFAQEVKNFKLEMSAVYEHDSVAYEIKLSEYLLDVRKDKTKHLFDYIRYARKKNKKTWIVFDNLDRGYQTFQRFVYNFAHLLSEEAGCVSIITLREDTYLDMKSAGFFDTRYPDRIFQIHAPELIKVIARRRRYVDSLIESGALPRPFKAYVQFIKLLNWHIKKLLTSNNRAVRELLSAFCMNNLRDQLAKLRDYYTSYHATFHDFYEEYCKRESTSGNGVGNELEDTELDYGKEHAR